MGSTFGAYWAAFYPAYCLICTVLIYRKRANSFIKCRNPLFLIVQNLGSMVSCLFLSTYIYLRPDYPCQLFYVGLITTYSLFATPLLLRTWEYCVNFHISLLKLHYRATMYVKWEKTSWVYEHRWVGSPIFLKRLLLFAVIFMCLPIIAIGFPSQFEYDDISWGCSMKGGAIYIGLGGGLIFLVAAVGMGFLIYRSQDAFKIKTELNILALLWFSILVTFVVYVNVPSRPYHDALPASTFILIGYVVTIFICNILPLYYAHQSDKIRSRKSSGTLSHFSSMLESVAFRNRFHEFLTRQFCQENLQFYELVMEWKALRPNDPERAIKARSIVDVFVVEHSVCQVHMPEVLRNQIIKESTQDDISSTIFDAALSALVEDMHVNSYRQFTSTESSIFDTSSSIDDLVVSSSPPV